jgi:hypothetical protein
MLLQLFRFWMRLLWLLRLAKLARVAVFSFRELTR